MVCFSRYFFGINLVSLISQVQMNEKTLLYGLLSSQFYQFLLKSVNIRDINVCFFKQTK